MLSAFPEDREEKIDRFKIDIDRLMFGYISHLKEIEKLRKKSAYYASISTTRVYVDEELQKTKDALALLESEVPELEHDYTIACYWLYHAKNYERDDGPPARYVPRLCS